MHSKLTLALACACALGVALAAATTLRAESTPEPTTTTETETTLTQFDQSEIQRQIDRYRHEAWRWQRTMGKQVTRDLEIRPSTCRRRSRSGSRSPTTCGSGP